MAANFSDRFTAEYGARDASCKNCLKQISKGDLRISFLSKAMYTSKHFYHPKCMFESFTNRTKVKIMSSADVSGISNLKYSDKNFINKCINDYVQSCNAAKLHANESKIATVKKKNPSANTSKAGTSNSKKATKRGKQDDEEEEDEPVKKKNKTTKKAAEPKGTKTGAATIKKTAVATKTGKAKAAAKKTTKPAAKVKKVAPAPAVVAPAPAPVVVAPPAPVATPAPATKTTEKKTLSDEAKRSFRSLAGKKLTVADFSEFTVNDLKLVLKLNDRSTTGNKTELSKQIVDYMTNGCPPRCPKCGGGRLRVKKTGKKEEYYCPGYMEDDDFVNCNFKSDSVVRNAWKNP